MTSVAPVYDSGSSKEKELKQSTALSESRLIQLAELYEGKAAYLRSLREKGGILEI